MNEYMSLKVSSGEHADLATQLTTLSTQGWDVVNIVSTGVYLVAYLSRPSTTSAGAHTGGADGWASAPSQGVAATAAVQQTTPAVPADWYPDPSGRYEHRYWDGTKWTDNVSRAGVMFKDPPIP